MSLEYEWSKDNLKKELKKSRHISNIILFFIGSGLYVWYMYSGIKSKIFDNKIIFINYLYYAIGLLLLLFITSKIYVWMSLRKNDKNTNKAYGKYIVTLDENKLIVEINEQKIEYNYVDIIKYKKKRKYFFIRTKEDKIGLKFKKCVIGEENYNKVVEYLNGKITC